MVDVRHDPLFFLGAYCFNFEALILRIPPWSNILHPPLFSGPNDKTKLTYIKAPLEESIVYWAYG